MRTLVIGGARSGKSRAAEALLADAPTVTYVATAYPADHDAEWTGAGGRPPGPPAGVVDDRRDPRPGPRCSARRAARCWWTA